VSSPTTTLSRPGVPPAFGLFAGVIAVSTASIFIRYAQQAGASSLAIAALRLTTASLVLLPFALARCVDEYRVLSARDIGIAVLSGAFLAAHFAAWILSFEYTSVISSVVLVSFSPVFVAIASVIFLKERLTLPVVIGMLVAITGGIVIALAGMSGATPGSNPLLGNALALIGAMCVGPYLIIARALRGKLSLLAYVTLVYGAAALLLLVAVLFTGTSLIFADPSAYVWIILLALVPQLSGHTSFIWAARRLPAVYATIPVLGEPIGSAILAMILLGETITPMTLLGAALALGGIFIMNWKRSGA
jgi:drug/metabolite transporter (DMT)-like permease